MDPEPTPHNRRPAFALRVVNVHQRLLPASTAATGALIESLSSAGDALWPAAQWPRMKLDGPLQVGASGGHGPIRYTVQEHVPGQLVRFRFTAPRGFHGWHALEVLDATAAHCVLEHRLEMHITGSAWITWPLFFRPLHDALVEDALAKAATSLGMACAPPRWSWRVRLLRWLARRTAARAHTGRRSHAA